MKTMDDLIGHYADELQKIYDNRTAGEYTFTGVLASFLRDSADRHYGEGPKYTYNDATRLWDLWQDAAWDDNPEEDDAPLNLELPRQAADTIERTAPSNRPPNPFDSGEAGVPRPKPEWLGKGSRHGRLGPVSDWPGLGEPDR